MALPPSTANWHWKNKNVTKWGQDWFDRELTSVTVKGDGDSGEELITIYDCKVNLEWTGKASDGSEVTGRLDIPEVSHEITLDKSSDYQYYWSITSGSSPAAEALVAMAKTRTHPILEEIFNRFPTVLVETHGKDLTVHSADVSPASASTATTATPSATAAAAKPAVKKEVKKTTVNSATVTVEGSFMAAADDLFSLLTDEKRIPIWTRAPAKSAGKPDTEYSLFGGGVTGKYVSLEPPAKIVQTWALQSPTWPSGHVGTLTTTLNQSSDSTKLPLGMEDEIKKNLEGYYIHGFKSIGYVRLFPSPPSYSSSSSSSTKRDHGPKSTAAAASRTSTSTSCLVAGAITVMVVVAAFAIPYLSVVVPGKRV
ncbi:activator of Hsp90 ATPase [Gymnopus androsaceus JB14]|uniref:Activator of Hsp90 ATPase n=1 Tax=Gymnopus androsaceus JB14 TaxID=1447944 RepID=A0A6A4GV52_9AGAR|nr:activator of Hsp90 ATPase [Gymnopus androsaceus JB14]